MKTHDSNAYITHLADVRKPSMAFDGSIPLEQWQGQAREKFKELLGLPLEKCDPCFTVTAKEAFASYQRIDFEFQSEPGYFVPCSILIPNGCTAPRPAAICLQGHTTGMHVSFGIEKFPEDAEDIAGGRDFAIQAVNRGLCAITVEQRYMGVCGQRAEDGKPACSARIRNAAIAALLLGRTACGERVWDIMRLIDVLETELSAYVDPKKILCMGNSGGGMITYYAACLEDRIALAMPSCSVCSYETSILATAHCPCGVIPGIRTYFEMGDLGCMIAPRPFVMVSGAQDSVFPFHGAKASFDIIHSAYESIGAEQRCRLIVGDGGHRFYPEQAWPVALELFQA